MSNTMKTIDEILEAVRKGGYYDGSPNERESDYLDTDVAKQALSTMLSEIIGETKPMTKRGEVSPDIYVEVIHRVEGQNALLSEQRKRAADRGFNLKSEEK